MVRVLVELDITKSYPNKVWLGPESFAYIQHVEMVVYPPFCASCKSIGHLVSNYHPHPSSTLSTGFTKAPNPVNANVYFLDNWVNRVSPIFLVHPTINKGVNTVEFCDVTDKAMELGTCVCEVCFIVEEEAAPLNIVVHLHSVLALDVPIDVKVKALDLDPSVTEASFVVEDEAAPVGVDFQLNSILPLVALVIVEAEAIGCLCLLLVILGTGLMRYVTSPFSDEVVANTFGISNSLDSRGGGDVVSFSPVASG
ncbi:hypothetical protein IEQ34_004332 [Dendrobium chrysotoxum]|uniref:Transposase n=1 Tax=Dendrobium chrysotoxum TaxID=161865 RepID=A0AAV7HG91_DENCH|nr:hypothetical protein IEQ34_004332 [Dendrobium chrysotoxum]